MQSRMNLMLVVVAAAAVLLWAAGVAQAGMIAYWMFDEASDAQVADDAVGTHDGMVGSTSGVDANDPILGVAGKFGYAYTFNGGTVAATASYVNVTSQTDLSGMAKLTLTAWFIYAQEPSPKNDLSIFYKLGTSSTNRSYFMGTGDTHSTFHFNTRRSGGDNGTLKFPVADVPPSTTTWHQLTGVYDSSTKEAWFFLDGVQKVYQSNYGTGAVIGASTLDLVLGNSRDKNRAWLGSLDDLGILNEALSPGKAKSLYNATTVAGLEAYNLGNMYKLFQVYDDPEHDREEIIGSLTWEYMAASIGHVAGDAWKVGGTYYVQLADDGAGVKAIPEPSTLLLLASGLLGLLAYAWRKRK